MRALLANGALTDLKAVMGKPPVAKLFTPDAAGTWLLAALDPANSDRAWGLCDPGLGSPELGWVSLDELGGLRGPLGAPVRRDDSFRPVASLQAYAEDARRAGIIIA